MPQVKESTYGEGDTSFVFAFNTRKNEGNPVRTRVLSTTDMELATGFEAAQSQIHMGTTLEPTSLPFWASPETLGFFAAFCMGQDSVSGTTNITHEILSEAIGSGYPGSFGLEEHLGGATVDASTDFNHKGVVVDEFTLSGGRTGMVNLDATVSGNGGYGTPQTQTESGLSIPTTYFPAESVTVGIVAEGTEHNPASYSSYVTPSAAFTAANMDSFTKITTALESWSVTYRNIWGIRRASGLSSSSGLLGACPVWTRREVEWELTFLQSAGFDSLTQSLLSGTSANNIEYAIAVEAVSDVDLNTSDYAGFWVVSPLTMLADTADGSFSDLNTDTVRLIAKSPLASDGQGLLRCYVHTDVTGVFNQ